MTEKLRVLLAEDSENDALLVLRQLRKDGFEPVYERVFSRQALAEALDRGGWELILSDYSMPGFKAPEALQLVRERGLDLPFIVISGTVGEVIAVEMMRAGAHDYFVKGQLQRLGEAIRREMESARVRQQSRRAEQQLRESQAMLARAESVAHIGSWQWEIASDTMVWSDEVYRIMGREIADQAPSLADRTGIYHPDDMSKARATLERAVADGAPYELEMRVLRPDGSVRVCRVRGQAELGPEGRPVRLFGSVQDITDQKQGEQEREKAHRQTETLLQATRSVLTEPDFPAAVRAIFDVGAELLGAPAGYFARLGEGVERNEVLFLDCGDLPSSVERSLPMTVGAASERAIRQRCALYDNDFGNSGRWKLTPDGGAAIENALFAPVILGGRTVGLFGFACKPGGFSDEDAVMAEALAGIAAVALREHRTREALQSSEEQHRALFQSSADALMTLEPPSWHFTSSNPATVRLFGMKEAADFLSRTPWDLSPAVQPDGGRTEDKAREMIQIAMQQGSHFFEWQHQRLDGSQFPATVLLTRVEVGGRAFLQASIRDMTEWRNMQSQVAQADRLSSMGMLAAGVAHEINNPLSYVLYNLESVADDLPGISSTIRELQTRLNAPEGVDGATPPLDELARAVNPALLDDIQARFRDALGGVHRIRDIARGLGTFSRVEKDQTVPVDLMHVIEVAINMAYNEIKYRARLVKDYGRIPVVLASEGRLSQVFLNLIINATHAIEEGDVEHNQIRVRTWSENGQVLAEVRDTGSGIAPEDLERLFEPFFTTKKIGVGSGLGLAISRSIVESYGGSIEVKSQAGKGTSFTIRLPVRTEPVETVAKSPGKDTEDKVRGRILIVDDEKGIRVAVERMLREHETVQAASGAEAKVLLEKDQGFDLILCDMMMSDISGMDLHQWLAGFYPDLARKLIFITGGAFTPRARDYLAGIENMRLEKPFDVVNFKKIVNDSIRLAKSKERDG